MSGPPSYAVTFKGGDEKHNDRHEGIEYSGDESLMKITMKPNRERWIASVLFLPLAVPLCAGSPECKPLEDSTRARLAEYAQGLFELPKESPLRISAATLDSKTCYYRLTFTTSPPAEPFRRTLFLSPDRRFC